EDGIRDRNVTGVQTCALPISYFLRAYFSHRLTRAFGGVPLQLRVTQLTDPQESFLLSRSSYTDCMKQILSDIENAAECLKDRTRSEERRVGKNGKVRDARKTK